MKPITCEDVAAQIIRIEKCFSSYRVLYRLYDSVNKTARRGNFLVGRLQSAHDYVVNNIIHDYVITTNNSIEEAAAIALLVGKTITCEK